MIYEDWRDKIGDGDILMFRGKRFYSSIIKRWTKSAYSHVGIAHWIVSGDVRRLVVCEALEGRGLQVFPLSQYLKAGEHIDWFEIVDPTIDRCQVVAWAMQRWGSEYASARQFFRSFITIPLLNFLNLPTKVDKDRYFCSMVAAEALRSGGWTPELIEDVPPEQCSPGQVALFPCLHRKGQLQLAEVAAKRAAAA